MCVPCNVLPLEFNFENSGLTVFTVFCDAGISSATAFSKESAILPKTLYYFIKIEWKIKHFVRTSIVLK
jgi:hypothetical protein